MSATSTMMDAAFPREREAEAVDLFSPDTPLTWYWGRLRYDDEPAAYFWLRARASLRRLWGRVWYDTLKLPRVSEGTRRMFPDDRAQRGSYAEARALCRTADCYLRAFPFGQAPFGDELFDNPTFIRPLLEPDKDELFRAIYTRTLNDFICPDLQEQVRQLTAALRQQTATVRAALEEDEHD